MFAVRLPVGSPVAPFGDPIGETRLLTGTLAESQDAALRAAGFVPTDHAPAAEPYLVYADRAWFTASFLRAVRATGGAGRVRLDQPDFVRETGPLQSTPDRPELAVVPAGHPPSLEGPDLPVDLALRVGKPPDLHPAFAHAIRGDFPTGARLVHGIEHWSHVLRVNLLALVATAEEARADFDGAPLWKRAWIALRVLLRARSLRPHALARALNRVGKGCRIHPTAVVEACQLGNDVEVGPFACLRGCIVGDGARIEDYAHASAAVIGPGARLGRTAMFNFSVAYPGAFVSAGGGWQMSVFGRDSFVAMTATGLDLSFGQPIRVEQAGAHVSAGTYFLGVAIGHRARIGAGVRIGYGMAVPNDAFVVAPTDDLLRRWPDPIEGPATIEDGVAVPLKRRGPGRSGGVAPGR